MPYSTATGNYPSAMEVSAHAVLAALRARRPGMGVKKAHKLLYYGQGHHLAAFGQPLFRERISAWDMGPVVGEVWFDEKNGRRPEYEPLVDEASLNTIGYVLSRYGSLSGDELERLTHSESPWRRADVGRSPGGSEAIHRRWIEEFFSESRRADDEDEAPLGVDAVAELTRGAEDRRAEPALEDEPAELRRRISELRSRTAPRAE